MSSTIEYYKNELEIFKEQNQFRVLRDTESLNNSQILFNEKIYYNLSSNDYLGIANNKVVINEFYDNLINGGYNKNYSLGSSSSRLLTGNYSLYTELEKAIASKYKAESSLVFNSGYHANIGILPAITKKGDLILSDKLNHASIIDGIKLSDADFIRYKHLDYEHLDKLLATNRSKFKKVIVVSESVFSMDGDVADLHKLVSLKQKYDFMLYVDEAHALGTRGNIGLGICEEQNLMHEIDFIVGTFGKAFASQGAFVVCNSILREFLINKMRSLIFTTALPPISVFWNLFLFNRIEKFSTQRENLKKISTQLKLKLEQNEYFSNSASNIIPVVLGQNALAEKVAAHMQEHGFFVFPVRPPTVPQGTARLRFSLTVDFNIQKINEIVDTLVKSVQKYG